MEVKTGYIYHIKDEFFDKINDKGLMINHENGRARPTYFTIKDKDILWFIPLSSRVSKYKPIIEHGTPRLELYENILEDECKKLLDEEYVKTRKKIK